LSSRTRIHPYYCQTDNLNTESTAHDVQSFTIMATDTRDGISNPGYRQAISRGNSAGTVLTATREQFQYLKSINVTVRYVGADGSDYFSRTKGHTTAAQYPFVQSSNILTKVAEDRAMSKFLKAVRGVQQSFSGQIFLGELREALHMLRHPADALNRALADYVHAVKRKKRQSPKQWSKALGGLWLEHSFGWKPFINDIEDAIKAYRRLKEIPHVVPISSSGADMKDVGTTTSLVGFAAYVLLREIIQVSDDCFVKNRGAVWCEASGTSFATDLFGFRWSEFVPTAWELLPWSFLADYFSNVGDVLENSVTNTSSLRWFNQSIVSTRHRMVVHTPDGSAIKNGLGTRFRAVQLESPGYHNAISRSVVRTWNAQVYVPPVTFEFPGKTAQYLNMAALLLAGNGIYPQTVRPWKR
jgi:hypothetical protein